MAFERLDGIRGTARIITAGGGKQVPETHLVCTHEQNEHEPHHASGVVGMAAEIAALHRNS